MLIQKDNSLVRIRFSSAFYFIQAIISANTRFEKQFSTEVNLAFFNGPGIYSTVILKSRDKSKKIDYRNVLAYANHVLKESLK